MSHLARAAKNHLHPFSPSNADNNLDFQLERTDSAATTLEDPSHSQDPIHSQSRVNAETHAPTT